MEQQRTATTGKQKRSTFKSLLSKLGGTKRARSASTPSQPLQEISNARAQSRPTTADTQTQLPVSVRTESNKASSRTSNSSETDHEDGSEADADASIRPITPSSLHTSASTSNLSHTNNTFRSAMTGQSRASTKPTTLLSTASDGGANRIAQASSMNGPGRPTSFGSTSTDAAAPIQRLPSHIRRDSTNTTSSSVQQPMPSSASITFSPLPPTSPLAGATSSPTVSNNETFAGSPPQEGNFSRYPPHSQPRTRDNPHPASIPPDNASTLTLASSMAPSIRNSGYRHDEDASVRALPPSRRGSDTSQQSKWSAAVLSGQQRARPASLLTVGTSASAPLRATMSGGETNNFVAGDEVEAESSPRIGGSPVVREDAFVKETKRDAPSPTPPATPQAFETVV